MTEIRSEASALAAKRRGICTHQSKRSGVDPITDRLPTEFRTTDVAQRDNQSILARLAAGFGPWVEALVVGWQRRSRGGRHFVDLRGENVIAVQHLLEGKFLADVRRCTPHAAGQAGIDA